jgi:hypothetical protein
MTAILTGCSAHSASPAEGTTGGQTAASARRALEEIPGAASASVNLNETMSGLNKHYGVLTQVTLAEGTSVPDPGKLINDLVAVSWSVEGKKPDQGVFLTLKTRPQIDVGPVARDDGWSDVSYLQHSSDPDAPQFAQFSPQSMTKKFGAWPGTVPPSVDGLVVIPA